MQVETTALAGVLACTPKVFEDDRGAFFEAYSRDAFRTATAIDTTFVQDNQSSSVAGVLRGLHYQLPDAQGKLVRVASGAVWDVVVDLRRSSPTCGEWLGMELSAANCVQLWIPPGFAHGFLALTDAEVLYKADAPYAPDHEHTIAWDDPDLGIDWPREGEPLLSPKDAAGISFAEAVLFD